MAVATKKQAAPPVATTPAVGEQFLADNYSATRNWVNKQIKSGTELSITRGGRELRIIEMAKDGTFKVSNATGDGFDYLPTARHLPAVLDGLIGG